MDDTGTTTDDPNAIDKDESMDATSELPGNEKDNKIDESDTDAPNNNDETAKIESEAIDDKESNSTFKNTDTDQNTNTISKVKEVAMSNENSKSSTVETTKTETSSTTPNKPATKSSESKYPGLSFILFVKSSSGGDFWFECGLCAPEKKMVPKEMTIHLRSNSHLYNLMDVECPHLKESYGNVKDLTEDSQELLKAILEFESSCPAQTMVAATPENIIAKREDLAKRIQKCKNDDSEENGKSEYNDAEDLETEIFQCGEDDGDESKNEEDEDQLKILSKPKEIKPIVIIPDYKFFQEGFQGKHLLMFTMEKLRKVLRDNLCYGPNHVYYSVIYKSYILGGKELSRHHLYKNLTMEEGDFLADNFNHVYLDKGVLSFRHKPILPVSKVQQVVKLFHNNLKHPSSGVLFEIISREFFLFPTKSLEICEHMQARCAICRDTPENLVKAHSFKVLEAYNDWPNKREMKALNMTSITNASYTRNPTKIVLVGDERDTCLKAIDMIDVSVRICPGLNLENAYDYISCDPLFGTGVLFVMMCGTFTFVRFVLDPECHNLRCSEPLLLPNVNHTRERDLFSVGMTAARNLHQAVMLNSAKDDVIFAHVLPIALTSNAKHLALKHQKITNHKSSHALLTKPGKDLYIALNLGMLHYNGWTDRFATELGYFPWNISAGFFAECMSNGKKIQKFNLGKLSEDGVHFAGMTQQLRKEMVAELAKTTLQKLREREKNGLLKNYVRAINPAVSKQKCVHRFEKIIIFCEPDSKILLDQFASNQVLVTANEITPPVVEQLCAQFNLKNCNSLWLFTSSVRPIAQRLFYENCSPKLNCPMQLPFIAPRDDLCASPEVAHNGISSLLDNVKQLIVMTKNIVGERCVAVVAPVMPLTLVNGDLMKHDMIHKLFNKMPQVFVTNNMALKALLPMYEILQDMSTQLCIDVFMERGLYPHPVFTYKPRIKGSFRTLGPKQTQFPFLATEWEEMFRNLIYMSLNGFPLKLTDPVTENIENLPKSYLCYHIKPSNNCRFSRVVFLGKPSFTDVVGSFECPLAQLVHLDLEDSDEEVNKVIDRISKFPAKTLFIYLTDFSLITIDHLNKKLCSRNNCTKPFLCTSLKNQMDLIYKGMETFTFVDQVVKITHQKMKRVSEAVSGSSFFIVAPVCPLRGYPVFSNSESIHTNCHSISPIKNEFQYLEGALDEWHLACNILDRLWSYVMESYTPNIGAPYKAILNYEVNKERSLFTPTAFKVSNDAFSNLRMWKSCLGIFVDLCLKMRKDGKFIKRELKPPPLPPPSMGGLLNFGGPPPPFGMPPMTSPNFGIPPPSLMPNLAEPTGASLAFPGIPNYSYPVPAMKPPEVTMMHMQASSNKISSIIKGAIPPPKILEESPEMQSGGTDFRIMIGKIDSSISDLDINMILSVIGNFIMFERPKVKNASYGVAKFLSEESAERCVRILDNYPLKPGPIEVRYLYYRDSSKDGESLAISVQSKDDDIRKLVDEVAAKLKLNVVRELKNIIIPDASGVDASKTDASMSSQLASLLSGSSEKTSPDVVEILAQETNTVGTTMAKSQAQKLQNYLKRKKLSPSKSRSRSKSKDRQRSSKRPRSRSRSRRYSRSYSRSRSRGRSRSRSKGRSRGRSRGKSYSRSYSRSRSRSPSFHNQHHNRGNFRGRGRFFHPRGFPMGPGRFPFRGRFRHQRGVYYPPRDFNGRDPHFRDDRDPHFMDDRDRDHHYRDDRDKDHHYRDDRERDHHYKDDRERDHHYKDDRERDHHYKDDRESHFKDDRPPIPRRPEGYKDPKDRRESKDKDHKIERRDSKVSRERSVSSDDDRPPIPRRPKSPPKERKVVSTMKPGLHQISSDEETLDNMPSPPRNHLIKISNVPLLVTSKFLNDLVMACGSPLPCRKEMTNDTYFAEFSSLKRAVMVAQHLNNWRLIDRNLKVEVVGDTKGVETQISMVEDSAIAKEIEGVFEEFRETFIVKIQGEIMKDPDIFTFKIFKCGVVKCREYDCHYYHNTCDRRRDYLEFKYKEKMCSFVKQQAVCPKGEYCNLCHNPIERTYHPKNYKTNVCLDWYELKRCPKRSFCAKAHPMNPDSFFTEAWKDLFIAGLDQSFFFFVGAIKMLYKVPDNEGGVPVMFITTIPDIAKFTCEVAKPVAKIHRLKIAIITDTMQDPAGAHILIGTPSGLANLVESKGSAPLGGLRVLILDEVTTLLNNPYHQHHLKFLTESIFSEVTDKKMICKIVTSETCHPSEISAVEELLKTDLSLHNPHAVDASIKPVISTKASLPVAKKDTKKSPKSKKKRSASSDRASEGSDWEVSAAKGHKSRSKGKDRRDFSSSGSSSSSRSSSRSSRSSSSRSRSRSKSRSKRRRGRSGSKDDNRETFSTLTSEILAQVKHEEAALLKEHEAAYAVYLEVPEMHQNYEDKYERFLQSYKKKYNTTEESDHMTKMWHKYWKLCIDSIKTKEWKKKRKNLIEKCRAKSRTSQAHEEHQAVAAAPKHQPLSSAAILMAITEISGQTVEDFSVGGALEILDVLSDKIGDIGPSIKNLVENVKIYGLKNKKAMELISSQQNVLALNLAFERILNLCQSLNEEQTSYCRKGIAWGLQLIKHAKNFKEEEFSAPKKTEKSSKSKKAVRFDLNLFAQQTYNQDANWIYSTLEESLEYVYGAKPDMDLVKQMFANISAIHLNMSASTPYLLGGSAGAAMTNNLGIVSQADQFTGGAPTPMGHMVPQSPATFATPSHIRQPQTTYASFSNTPPPPPPPPEKGKSFTNPPPPPPPEEAPPPSSASHLTDTSPESVVAAIMSMAKGGQ